MDWEPYTPVIDAFEREMQEIINRWKTWQNLWYRGIIEPN